MKDWLVDQLEDFVCFLVVALESFFVLAVYVLVLGVGAGLIFIIGRWVVGVFGG